MHNSHGTRHIAALTVVAFVVALFGLAPLTARAGAPGAPPAAVQLSVSFDLRSPRGNIAFTGSGVVNRTGDGQLSFTLSEPQQRSLDIIHVDDTTYISMDGGPYTTQSDSSSGSGPPPGCMRSPGGGGLPNPQALLGPGGNVQDLGPEMLDGVTVEHIAVHGDLQAFLTQIASLILATPNACVVTPSAAMGGTAASAADLRQALGGADVQQALAGATFDVDLYVEQPGNFPRRLVLAIDVPGAQATLRLQVDATPLAAPVPISAPQ